MYILGLVSIAISLQLHLWSGLWWSMKEERLLAFWPELYQTMDNI
jgi:hypothetical protein